ncbi:TlpA family protein disulfide reductase [Aquimarina sp. M1]
MNLKLCFCISFILIMLLSCNKESKVDLRQIEVDLVKQSSQGPFPTMTSGFEMVDTIPSNMKGIPKLDSLSIQSIRRTSEKKLKKLLNDGKIDTLTFKEINIEWYALSAIKEDKQIIILDENRNLDFSDDKKYIINKKIRETLSKDEKLKDSFPLIILPYKRYLNGKILDADLRTKILPHKNFFYLSKTNPSTKELTYLDLLLVSNRREHWLGNFQLDNIKYKTAISDHWNDFQVVFREQGKPFYSRRNQDEQYEEFKEGDTVQLGTHFIKIDSVGADLEKLYLQKLNITSLPHGYKEGHTLRDYAFTDIEGNTKRISHLLRNKDLLLIDFWGTWCAPCLKLTPDLKQLHKDYPDVAILGVDFDFEKEPGVEYIKEKELDWTHMYVERVRNDSLLHSKIVSKLRVDNYPTFMLIDKDLKIVYRGIGKKGLTRVKEFIDTINALKAQKRKKLNP